MRERSPGHWQLRAFAGTDDRGRPVQVSRTFTGTRREATKALARFVSETAAGNFVPTRATVGELLDKWLEHIEGLGRRPSTIHGYRNKIDHTIRPALGHVKLSKLRADHLDSSYKKWSRQGLAPATVRQYHAILSAALHQAERWGWIGHSPARRATPPSVHQPRMHIPTSAQLSVLYNAARATDTVLATAIALAAMTGLRRGELVALRWSDVDFANQSLRVERAITVVEGVVHEGPTKTHQVRQIALDQVAIDILKDRLHSMTELSEQAESPLVDDPYVLSYQAHGGIPVGPSTVTHRFWALCRSQERVPAGTDGSSRKQWPYRFHDLRHFSVSTLVAAGVDIRTVSERHGHAQATMTLNRYAHALPERDREAARLLGRAFTG